MGKGDKKSRRGKISSGTYGVRRPRKKSRTPVVANSKSKKRSNYLVNTNSCSDDNASA